MLKAITNDSVQGELSEYGVYKPHTKKEYTSMIWTIQKALEKLEKRYIKEGDNLLYMVEGINDYHFHELKEVVTCFYEFTTKAEMDNLYNGILRSVYKMKNELN